MVRHCVAMSRCDWCLRLHVVVEILQARLTQLVHMSTDFLLAWIVFGIQPLCCYEWDKRKKEKKERKKKWSMKYYIFQCRVCRSRRRRRFQAPFVDGSMVGESRCRVLLLIFLLSPEPRSETRRTHIFILYSSRRSLNFAKEEIFAQESESCLTAQHNKNRVITAWEFGESFGIVEEKKKGSKTPTNAPQSSWAAQHQSDHLKWPFFISNNKNSLAALTLLGTSDALLMPVWKNCL